MCKRAVDSEGEVLDILVQSRRNKKAALKLMRKLLKKQGYAPNKVVTDTAMWRICSLNVVSMFLTRRYLTGLCPKTETITPSTRRPVAP